MAQAEAEYKDFILFYPTLEESAEAQEKVCMIHYRQMEKADRDPQHALRAEDECRNVLVQFPNSKFAPRGAAASSQRPGSDRGRRIPAGRLLSRQRQPSRPQPTGCRIWPPSTRSTARPTKQLALRRFLFEDGSAVPAAGRRGLCANRPRVSFESLRRRREEEA